MQVISTESFNMTTSRKDFRIVAYNQERVNQAIRILTNMIGVDEKNQLEIIIRLYKRNRSREQNSLYWKWLTVIEMETGQDRESLHEHYKGKFLARILVRDDPKYSEMSMQVKKVRADGAHEIAEAMRSQIMFLTSTSVLTTKQFSEYMNCIERDVSEQGIALPQPDDR